MPSQDWVNATDEELEGMIESLQRRMTTGEILFVTLPGGGQMQRSFQNTKDAKAYVRELQYEAFTRGMTYENGRAAINPYAQRIRRTIPDYSNG